MARSIWDKTIDYFDKWIYTSNSLPARYFEQSGIPDVVEEIARIDDEGFTLANALRLGMQAATTPLQALSYGAIELNRASTAGMLGVTGAVDDYGLGKGLGIGLGIPGFTGESGDSTDQAWKNYRKAWTPPSRPVEKEDGTYEQAQGVYHAATFGTLVAGAVDSMVAEGQKPWQNLLFGKDWNGGSLYKATQALVGPGEYANGSYLPDSFDIRAPTAGTQVNETDLRYAALVTDITYEMAIDPLNFAMKPMAAWLKGRSLVHPGQAAKGLSTVGASQLRTEDLVSAVRSGTLQTRAAQVPPGIGMWNQQQFVNHMFSDKWINESLTALAKNKDFGTALKFFMEDGVPESRKILRLDTTVASELAKMSVYLDTPEEIAHMNIALAYRNVASTNIVRESLSVSNPTLANSLNKMLGIGDDIIHQALVDFPNGSILPDGHVIKQTSSEFLKNALMQNPEAQTAWDALAAEEKASRFDQFATAVDDWKNTIEPRWTLDEKLFAPGRADQPLSATFTNSGAKRALVRSGLAEPTPFAKALTSFTSKVHVLPGGMHRFGLKHMLVAKPGLVFNVDDAQSGQHINDYIEYASNIIGDGRGFIGVGADGKKVVGNRTISNRIGRNYRFSEDPEVVRIKNAFFDAATTTTNPAMLRATLVDQLQEYALAKIGESSGFQQDVAAVVAKMGMDRGRNINAALSSADEGYSTVMLEDGVLVALTNHPTSVQQGANIFVPLMDLAGVRKALHSAPMRALTDPDSLLSVAEISGFEALGVKNRVTGLTNLNAFGRTGNMVGGTYHAMVDYADIVNNAFKMWVLLRLGYPVRNLTEGYLSSVGSGVGLLQILKHTEAVIPNLGYNWKTVGKRLRDKTMTVHGTRANETTWAAAVAQSNAALSISSNHIGDMIEAVTDQTVIDSLVRVAASNTSSPEDVARAREALGYLSSIKQRLAGQIDADMVQGRFAAEIDDVINANQRLYHADTTGALKPATDFTGRPIEFEAGVNALPVGTSLDRPLSMTPFSGPAQGVLDTSWTPFVMSRRAVGAKNPRPGWAKTRIRSRAEGQRQWEEAMDNFDEMLKTHYIEYREGPTGMWKPFRSPKPAGKYRKYNHGSSDKWEFRAREKGAAQVPPKVVGVDTYGKEIDLRGGYGKQAILDNYSDIDEATIDAAIAMDRAAQEKLSSQLAKHGVYRTVFDDAPEWGGVNVLVHPKGIGTSGLQRAIESDVDNMIKARMEALGPIDEARIPKNSKGQVRLWNKGMGGQLLSKRIEHVDPNFPYQLADTLKNGGFDDIVAEAIEQHVALKRQNVGFRTALQRRQSLQAKMAKRAGTPIMSANYHSYYGDTYLTDSALNGLSGQKYRQLTSGDATVQSTIGFTLNRSDRVDNLRASWLRPRDILPDDPYYFDGLSNLANRYYSDNIGAMESRSLMRVSDPSSVVQTDHIDPVMLRALGSGDRQRLYAETIEWANSTAEGRNWVRSIGLQPRGADYASDATLAARAKNANRRNPAVERLASGEPTKAAKRNLTGQQHIPYRQKGYGHRDETDVELIIADVFNFADNFLLSNPRVADLFITGNMSPSTLRALYDQQPWELKPFRGSMAPTSAETQAIIADMYSKRDSMAKTTDQLNKMLSGALQKIGSNPETRLLRHPMFETIAQQDLQQRISAAEQMYGRQITALELSDLSERSRRFAVRKMKETLYTLESRSTLEDYLRFVSPFFPAWYNTATRWGRFYRRNPGGVAKIASRWNTISSSGIIVDENGNEVRGAEAGSGAFSTYVLFPVGVGTFGPVQKMFPGAEEAMSHTRIPMRAFDVIFQGEPGNPGFGPLIGMPLSFILEPADQLFQNEVGKFLIDKVLPVGTENTGNRFMDAVYPFLPTGIKRFMDDVFSTNKQKDQYFTSMQVLATERIKGTYTKTDDAGNEVVPTDQQLLDDALKLSRLMSMTKVASAFISPVAQQQQGYQDFIAGQWREIQDAAYAAGEGDRADEIFLSQYPMDFLLTLSASKKLTSAQQTAYATSNQGKYKDIERLAVVEMEDPGLLWFTDNYRETEDGQGAIDLYSSADFNPYSRARQFHTGPEGTNEPYIQMKDPAEGLIDGMVQYGWQAYNQVRADISARLVAQGLPEGSYEFLKKRGDWMANAAPLIGQQFPDWYNEYTTGPIDTSKYARRAEHFKYVVNNPEWLAGKEEHELPKLIDAYLDARDAAVVEMEARGDAKTTSAKANWDIRASLELKADALGKDSASFRLWYDRYFRNDVVNVDEGE